MRKGVYFFISLNVLFSLKVFCQCLSGAYTIGGTAPDYSSFSAAVTALSVNGVCGQVVFNVRPGTYTEQIAITAVTGASASNTITFQSENGDSASVSLNFPSSSSSSTNYVLYLNGADYLIFKKMRIERTGSNSYARVVEIGNAACIDSISNCSLISPFTLSTSNIAAVIYSGNGVDSNNVFQKNRIINGSIGIYYYGTIPTYERGTRIIYNVFKDQSTNAINLYYQSSYLYIGYNTISSSTANYMHAIYCAYCNDYLSIIGNKISGSNPGIGLANCSGNFSGGIIENNFIEGKAGIVLYGCSGQEVLHNSTRCSGWAAYEVDGGSYNRARNNIFYNSGSGPVINFSSNPNQCTSDHNVFYSTGTNFGSWNTAAVASLADWQSMAKLDSNSVVAKPPYVSSTDLHIMYDNHLKEMGDPNVIFIDIDAQLRNNAAPDIGADEFPIPALDAQVSLINPISLTSCSGNNTVDVKIKNVGTNALTSVTIHWDVNGILQPSFPWTGSLSSLQLSADITIGSYNFTRDSLHVIRVWTGNPNGSVDTHPLNDTATTTFTPLSLSGIFTIGGTAPDYPTITAAINDMNTRSICGPITFNLRNGMYTEYIPINSIPGSSTVNTVTFQSESGDSSTVKISNVGTWPTIISLNSSSNITFRKMTLKVDSTSNSSILIAYSGKNNRVENCVLYGSKLSGDIIHSQGNGMNYFTNNLILLGTTGIRSNTDSMLVVTGNSFIDQSSAGIISSGVQAGASIIGNNFTFSLTPLNLQLGISLLNLGQNPGQFIIKGNNIKISQYGYGIKMDNCNYDPGNEALIANNFISIGGTSSATGMWLTNASYINIFHNSINIYSTSTIGNYCLYNGASNVTIRNNIFANPGGTYALYTNALTTTCNYNDLFTTGPVLARTYNSNYTDYATFLAWQNATGLDLNSKNVNPQYISNTNLHINQNNTLASAGIPVSVSNDIDNDTRDSLFPDIGADEFSAPILNDASVSALVVPPNSFCSGPQNIRVCLKNMSSNLLTSATIKCEVNGSAQTPYSWTGSLPYGDTSFVTLGSYTFNPAVYYNLKAWSEIPNTVADPNPTNDTSYNHVDSLSVLILNSTTQNVICSGQNIVLNGVPAPAYSYSWAPASSLSNPNTTNPFAFPTTTTTYTLSLTDAVTGCTLSDTFTVHVYTNCCLSGVYTIGGTSPDFTSFNNAVNVLSWGGVCGPVIFNVRPGTYTEQVEIPQISGSTAVNTITFQAENGDSSSVILRYANSVSTKNYTLQLNGCSNIIIQKLTIEAIAGTMYDDALSLYNSGNNIKILNNRIKAAYNDGSSRLLIGWNFGNNYEIKNNLFLNGAGGVSLYNITATSVNVHIHNNIFQDQKATCGYISKLKSFSFNNNLCRYGSIATMQGLSLDGNDTLEVMGNIFEAVSYWGININNHGGSPAVKAIIANNFINMKIGSGSGGYSIGVSNSSCVDVLYNSVRIDQYGSSTLCCFSADNSSSIKLMNNALINLGGSLVTYIRPAGSVISDYNDFFTSGQYIGVYGPSFTSAITTLPLWVATTQLDSNSICADPVFTSATNLHISAGSPVIGKAKPVPTVLYDIDGHGRNTMTSDIGADELISNYVHELYNDHSISVLPNPNNGVFTVTFDSPAKSDMIISVKNILGETVFTKEVSPVNTLKIELPPVSSGMYFLHINTSGKTLVQKMIIRQ